MSSSVSCVHPAHIVLGDQVSPDTTKRIKDAEKLRDRHRPLVGRNPSKIKRRINCVVRSSKISSGILPTPAAGRTQSLYRLLFLKILMFICLDDNVKTTTSDTSVPCLSSFSSSILLNDNSKFACGESEPFSDAIHDDSDDPDYCLPSDDGFIEDDDVYDILADTVSSDSNFRQREDEFGLTSPIINPEIPNFQQDSPPSLQSHQFTRKVDSLDDKGNVALSLLQERLHFHGPRIT
jgi:hypothetical protein